MTKGIQKLYCTMSLVAFGCLVTAVLLDMWTGSEQQKTVVTSPVFSDITWKDEGKTRYIWAKSVVDKYDASKEWTVVKMLSISAACLVMVALVMTLIQKRVKNTSVYGTMDFISNVFIILAGIYLVICLPAFMSVIRDPESVNQMDQNVVNFLKLVALIVTVTALVSHLLYKTQKLEREILHV